MKKIDLFRKKALCAAFLCFCSLPGFSEETWNFDPTEVAEYAAFLKQPSAIDGQCNAEALGIDVNREGFSWDDMNTWKNSEGVIWKAYSSGYSETVFGVCVNASAPFNGKTSGLTWTTTEGDNKWYPAIAGVANLKGNLSLTNCLATVVHISGTQLETARIQMTNENTDCYLHVRRNLNLKQLDLSGSTGRCRQLEGYRNAFTNANSFVCNDCRQTEFLDWLLNLEDNLYTFSTLPLHPATGAILKSGYKSQWSTRGGMPVGSKNEAGDYEIESNKAIDLSSEYTVHGNTTVYTWKDQEGNTIEPTTSDQGRFSFDNSHIGNTYRCEMTNATYPDMTLNTVWVTVKAKQNAFNFDPEEVKAYAAFFKQPSAIEGKCNAEAIGIDIHREGFSWDDMNTWRNAEGNLWVGAEPAADGSGYCVTFFGVAVNSWAPYYGKTSNLKWFPYADAEEKYQDPVPGAENLKGTFAMENCLVNVLRIQDTQIDTIRLQMNNSSDSYMHVRRNLNLKQLDLSGSTGKIRQLAGYRNAFTDANSFVCNNCRQTEFLDWLLNLEDNLYTFSTLPLHPATGAILTSGYKLQWNARGGLPIGTQNEAGGYEVGAGDYIDLSSEYTVHENTTTYVWKDQEGNTVEPTEAAQGRFAFDNSHAGNTYRCEMKNATYPDMTLNTVWVTIIETHPSAIQQASGAQLKIMPNPADSYIVLEGAEVLKTQIYNLSGSCVKETGAGIQTIDIADLTPGMYLVRVTTAEGNSTTRLMKK